MHLLTCNATFTLKKNTVSLFQFIKWATVGHTQVGCAPKDWNPKTSPCKMIQDPQLCFRILSGCFTLSFTCQAEHVCGVPRACFNTKDERRSSVCSFACSSVHIFHIYSSCRLCWQFSLLTGMLRDSRWRPKRTRVSAWLVLALGHMTLEFIQSRPGAADMRECLYSSDPPLYTSYSGGWITAPVWVFVIYVYMCVCLPAWLLTCCKAAGEGLFVFCHWRQPVGVGRSVKAQPEGPKLGLSLMALVSAKILQPSGNDTQPDRSLTSHNEHSIRADLCLLLFATDPVVNENRCDCMCLCLKHCVVICTPLQQRFTNPYASGHRFSWAFNGDPIRCLLY